MIEPMEPMSDLKARCDEYYQRLRDMIDKCADMAAEALDIRTPFPPVAKIGDLNYYVADIAQEIFEIRNDLQVMAADFDVLRADLIGLCPRYTVTEISGEHHEVSTDETSS